MCCVTVVYDKLRLGFCRVLRTRSVCFDDVSPYINADDLSVPVKRTCLLRACLGFFLGA